MRILVTGSEGTLGKPLVKALRMQEHHDVYCIDLKHQQYPESYARCDISDYRQIERVLNSMKFDYIYHLAAEFGRMNGEEYFEQVWRSNVIGTRNILELQKILKFKLIMFSSSEIYGESTSEFLTETDVPVPQSNDYAISKWVNECQCNNFIKRYGNKIMIIRLFNAYGPGEYYTNYRSVCCLFAYRALHGLPFTVYKNYHRVFMYIDDLIPTLSNLWNNFESGEIFNIGGVEYRSVEDLANIVIKESGASQSLIKILPEDQHNIVNKRPNIEKARFKLAHNPIIELEEGIAKTISWMKKTYNK